MLTKSLGKWKGMYNRYNVGGKAECAKDARTLYGLPIPESYCTVGVDADVVLVPIMSQYVPNVAGWGGDAGEHPGGS